MRFHYACKCGFTNGPWQKEEAWPWKTCWACDGFVKLAPMVDDMMGSHPVNFIPDVPEHYSIHLDRKVRSRRHLYDIYKREGLQDFSPVTRPSSEFRGDPQLPYRL